MDNSEIFKNRKADFSKLETFGFEKNGALYRYTKTLSGSGFEMTVTVNEDGRASAVVVDPDTGEYTMHLTDSAGSFVGAVRTEYEALLTEIAEKCYERDVFKSELAGRVISYVREKYGDELEFLWEKFPQNAGWRRSDNKKWYAALMVITKRKLCTESDERIEIIDLRMPPEELSSLVDGKKYYAGYHMNKKNWVTIMLDGSVSFEELCRRICASYELAKKR